MEIFKTLNEMLGDGSTLTITIAKKGEELIVSVLPGNNLVKDTKSFLLTFQERQKTLTMVFLVR